MYTTDGSPLVDTRYARDWTARRMNTPDGHAARKLGAIHRRQRPENLQRPAPSLDELGLGSPPQTPTGHNAASASESRHRRAAAMLQRALRKVALDTNPDNAGRKSEYWNSQLHFQRKAVSLFGNCSKTALQLVELLSINAGNRDNAYLVNTVFGCLLSRHFSTAELINADTHREVFAALSKHGPECPVYPSLCCQGLLLLLKMCCTSKSRSVVNTGSQYGADFSVDVGTMFTRRESDSLGTRSKDAAAVARAIEFSVVNSEIFERLMRCHVEENIQSRQRLRANKKSLKTKNSKTKKKDTTTTTMDSEAKMQVRAIRGMKEANLRPTPRAGALRKMCGSAYFERKRRNLPKKKNLCSELVRNERQAILVVDDASPLLSPIPTWPSPSHHHQEEEGREEEEGAECFQHRAKAQRLRDVLQQRDPGNERLLLHLVLQCIDEISLMSPNKTVLKRELLCDQFRIQLLCLLRVSVDAAAEPQFWRSRPALMAACWYLLCLVENITGTELARLAAPPQKDDNNNDDDDDDDDDGEECSCRERLVRWKTRNPLTAGCLFRQKEIDNKANALPRLSSPRLSSPRAPPSPRSLSSPRMPLLQQFTPNPPASPPHRSPSPTTKLGLLSLEVFEGLQQELVQISALARSPSSEMQLSQDVLDRMLLHSLSIIEDQHSTADNKLEVARFLLDVLAAKQIYRRGMRTSEHWLAVESVLTWCRFNDVLLLTQNQSDGLWETLDGMRSAGLRRLDLPVTMISKDSAKILPRYASGHSVYTYAAQLGNECIVHENEQGDEQENNDEKDNENENCTTANTPEGEENLTFIKLVSKLGELDRACRLVVIASDPELSSARLFPLTNSWSDALQSSGDAIARASLNGPIGVIDVIDFHSGNPFILERGATLLVADGCSAPTLVAAGAVEVIARSLRKVPTKHPFYLSAAVKASGIIVRAFEGAGEDTTARLLSSESDIALTDLVAWVDTNAAVFMPPLGSLNAWIYILRSRLAVSSRIAVVDAVGSNTLVGVVPYGAIVSLIEMKGEWVHVECPRGDGGGVGEEEEKEVVFRGWFMRRSLRSAFLKLLP